MKKSGLADSPFFKEAYKPTPLPVKPKEKKKVRKVVKPSDIDDTMTPRNRDTMQPSNHETTMPRYH